jgi:hypothetical protein
VRDETGEWLKPMLDAAEQRDIKITKLMDQAIMHAAEEDSAILDRLAALPAPPGIRHWAIDWVPFGALLRHQLGWDDTYPAFPDFPEARNQP